MESHLLQMRGLKLPDVTDMDGLVSLSHLLQMRGLKLTEALFLMLVCRVASFTDAWIETQAAKRRIMQARVASFTDAWIETCYYVC